MGTAEVDTSAATASVAVLIASKDGAATIADTVRSAACQCDVYVVSDGSTDDTAVVAREAGAHVLDLDVNVGKPAAIYKAVHDLGLLERYELLSILDDDTVIGPDFVDRCRERLVHDRRQQQLPVETERRRGDRRLEHRPVPTERRAGGAVIVVGKTITNWTDDLKWNPWIAARAYSYWRYQVTVRRGQDAFNALNCISGSNSMYRSTVLGQVLVEQTPYIVDDTYWVLEVQRRKLGRVRYAPEAEAFIQDPTNGREWYKQNLRWLWGTCQGIVGHRVGRVRSWFDFWYVSLIFDWILYALLWPVLIVTALVAGWIAPLTLATWIGLGYALWGVAAAIALKKPRLVLFIPFIFLFDWLYRINFLHAAFKTARQPTVTSCKWESPTRYDTERGGDT
jgi:poly-beta-1,6-N-acetyl-D-glucosamine synthase